MELSSSRTSVTTDDDYSLITYEKCNPPRAKLFIVFLASLVVATIIVLLVVLTRLKPIQNINHEDPDIQCPDIAIIGGGLAGTYAAWRLRELNKSVVLYEKSPRLGGRIYTYHVTGTASNRPRELGASFFLPSLHPRLDSLVQELGLETESFIYGASATSYVNYLRGEYIGSDVLCRHTCPYKLSEDEYNKSPRNLLRYFLESVVEDQNTTEWRATLNKQSLKNVLLQTASYEAYNYLHDTLCWWEYYPDGNSLAFFDYVTENTSSEPNMAEAVTVKGGMERLIDALLSETQRANDRFTILYNNYLLSMDSQPDYNYLRIQRPEGATGNVPSCARHAILALPPNDILQLGLSLSELDDIWRPQFEKISRISLLRILVELRHAESLFVDGLPPWGSLRTDLPIQDVHVTETSCNSDQSEADSAETTTWSDVNATADDVAESACSTAIQVNVYGEHLDYWLGLLKADGYDVGQFDVMAVGATSSQFANQLARYLAEILSTNDSIEIDPESLSITLRLWSSDLSTPAFHFWKPNTDWGDTSSRIRFPIDDVRVYVTGAAFAPKYLQFWAEGALASVDELLSEIELS